MFNKAFLCLAFLSMLLSTGCVIRGRVFNEYGAPMVGLTVVLSGDASITATTNKNGYYH